ncbi:MAG: alpha/beta hydrolase [Gammaproteobacteria bacterium]
MKLFLVNSLLFMVLALGLLNVWFYTQQKGMLFFPTRPLEATPADWGLVFEDVSLTTRDQVRLNGWFLPASDARQVLLFFHGNAGNISHRGDSVQIFHGLGLSTLIIDYRGYGQSQGRISERGLYRDARAAWDYLVEARGYADKDIIVFGRSLGGAVAAQLASQVQPRALMVESSFSSVRSMARRLLPLLSRLVYLRYDFATAVHVHQVSVPVLVLHSPEDEIIPFSEGQQVFAAANSPKYFQALRGSHNGGFLQSQPDYQAAMAAFLRSLPERE